MDRFQDKLSSIASPIYSAELEARSQEHKRIAKARYWHFKKECEEKAEKGEKSNHMTIRPHERFTFPLYELEELIKADFERYSIEDFGINDSAKIIYVYW